MKKSNVRQLSMSLFLVMAMIFATQMSSFAQGAPGKGRRAMPTQPQQQMVDRIPNITTEQKAKIMTLRTAMMKDVLPLQNQLREKQAKLRTLSTADKVDIKAINSLIDEMAILRADVQKKRMKFIQDVRALLTDDQRIYFDSHQGQFMRSHGKMGNRGAMGPRGGCMR